MITETPVSHMTLNFHDAPSAGVVVEIKVCGLAASRQPPAASRSVPGELIG